ncbi:MAG: DUF983 domain-containing protein [Sphingomonas sp.]|uniref:DUF983 domain-containing protein n=1 Tax=Sphingomonas sp. TaxID=28214 RepID=UPI003F7F3979
MEEARPDAGARPVAVAPVEVALKGLCPRCGAPTLFAGWIRFADSCKACGLDFSAFNVGDGPAALLILVLGGAIVAAAIVLELSLSPPFWVHVLIWVPLSAAAVVAALRVSKAGLLALEYRNKAREARSEDAR